MKQDISAFAGFPLEFDPASLRLFPGTGLDFAFKSQTAQFLGPVLRMPQAAPSELKMFHLYDVIQAPPDALQVLRGNQLKYGFTLLIPQRVGDEFIKTHGHFHPLIDQTAYSHPEVYAQVYGHILLFLQRQKTHNSDDVEACYLIDMPPGTAVTIPPGYGHMQINPYSEPSLTAGLYSACFKPEFDFVVGKRGFAYYVLAGRNETIALERNPRYGRVPEMTWLTDTRGTDFEPPHRGIPLWSGLLADPDRYRFLSDLQAMTEKFPRN